MVDSFDWYLLVEWVVAVVVGAGYFFLLWKGSRWAAGKYGADKGWDLPSATNRIRVIGSIVGLWLVFRFLPISEQYRDQLWSLVLLASVAMLVMVSVEPLRRLFLPAQYHSTNARSGKPVAPFKGKVFVSYRRADTQRVVDRLCDKLFEGLGRDSIFRDIDSVGLGQDFREVVEKTLDDCTVGLVVIGTEWLGMQPDGKRRIDEAQDLVRLEVRELLNRKIPLIPILVDATNIPAEADLPDDLKDLAYRNSARLRPDPDFENDVERLVRGIRQTLD